MGCEFCELTEADKQDILFVSAHWTAFLSRDQLYLGRSVIGANRHVAALSDLTSPEWEDLRAVICRVEAVCRSVLNASMFNWTCLMNDAYKRDPANPHVHLHVRPRYAIAPSFRGIPFPDPNFGQHYQRNSDLHLPVELRDDLCHVLRAAYSEGGSLAGEG